MSFKIKFLLVFFTSYFLFFCTSAWADKSNPKLVLKDQISKPGQLLQIPLIVDNVDNLAGIKLVLDYDQEKLNLKGVTKANKAESLMHMINDRTPGTLILVMAGAKGISLHEEPLAFINIQIKDEAEKGVTTLNIKQVEVMTDKLKPVQVKTQSSRITIENEHQKK